MGYKKTAKGMVVRSGTKKHLGDIRLFNNSGIDFPICKAVEKMLDLRVSVEIVSTLAECTCKNCKKIAKKRYPWARFGEKKS